MRRTFNVAYDEHHKSWKTYKYDWLPNIPKELGEKVPDEHLKKQTVSKTCLAVLIQSFYLRNICSAALITKQILIYFSFSLCSSTIR